MYHIGYINANSLPDRKFAQAICLLEKTFDILFIAEHWFQHHELRLSHPLVYCSTSLPPRSSTRPLRGRHHGGIYLLVKQHIRPLIQSTTSSQHSITVTLPGFHFAAVYYPPFSIQEEAIKQSLQQIGPVDLLLGDINTKFTPNISLTTTRSHSAPSLRSRLFQPWAVQTNMVHVSDIHQNTLSHQIPDHVFTSVQLQSNISLSLMSTKTLDFPTDHKCLLHVTYQPIPADSSPPTNWPSEQFSDNQPIRFHVQRLKQPDIANQFREHWGLIEALLISHKGAEKYDIDMLDSILCSSVQAIAESVLGVYKPGDARKKTDSSAQRLAKELDMSSSIQLLKRAQRASTIGVHMVSSTIYSTPMEECIAHYTKMFNFTIPASQLQSTQSASSVLESESQGIPISHITHDQNSILASIDESTLLASQLLDRI